MTAEPSAVIHSLVVYKDAAGELEVEHLSNLTRDEAIEVGTKIGALIGLGIAGEEGMEAGAEAGAEVRPPTTASTSSRTRTRGTCSTTSRMTAPRR